MHRLYLTCFYITLRDKFKNRIVELLPVLKSTNVICREFSEIIIYSFRRGKFMFLSTSTDIDVRIKYRSDLCMSPNKSLSQPGGEIDIPLFVGPRTPRTSQDLLQSIALPAQVP